MELHFIWPYQKNTKTKKYFWVEWCTLSPLKIPHTLLITLNKFIFENLPNLRTFLTDSSVGLLGLIPVLCLRSHSVELTLYIIISLFPSKPWSSPSLCPGTPTLYCLSTSHWKVFKHYSISTATQMTPSSTCQPNPTPHSSFSSSPVVPKKFSLGFPPTSIQNPQNRTSSHWYQVQPLNILKTSIPSAGKTLQLFPSVHYQSLPLPYPQIAPSSCCTASLPAALTFATFLSSTFPTNSSPSSSWSRTQLCE